MKPQRFTDANSKETNAATSSMAQEKFNDVDLAGKSEQLFFEFFGMYTKESIKS